MKKKIMTTIGKFTVAGLLLITVVTVRGQRSWHASSDKNTTVNYLGTKDDEILFNVTVNNPDGNKFSVIITDNDGYQLFQKVYYDKKFDKKFRFPEFETGKVNFIVRNFKDESEDVHSFEVNNQIVDDVVVTSVK